MLIALRFADEVIAVGDVQMPGGRKPDPREIRMGEQLVDALHDKFDPREFKDEYRQRVLELIDRKARGEKPRLAKPVERKPSEKPLAEVLKASIAEARRQRRSA
jgi:DNA end-binding protein Ku